MLEFNHGLDDIKDACCISIKDIENFFTAVEKANEDSDSFSTFIEKIEEIILSNQVYLRCAVFHMVMREHE